MSNHRKNSEFSRSYSDVDKSYGNSSPHASSRRSGGAKYFANLLDYGNNTNDYETVKSSMASTKSVDSIATRRSSLSLSLATVPSLVIDVPKSIPVKGVSADITFATTIPIVTRDKYDLFGVGDIQFSRRNYKLFGHEEYKCLMAEEEVKNQTTKLESILGPQNLNDFKLGMFEEFEKQIKRENSSKIEILTLTKPLSPGVLGRKAKSDGAIPSQTPTTGRSNPSSTRASGDAYNIRLSKDQDTMLKSDDERQKQLDHATQRKKDRKDEEKINRVRRGSVIAPTSVVRSSYLSANGTELQSPNPTARAEKSETDLNFTQTFRKDTLDSVEAAMDDMKDVYDHYIGNQAILDFQYKYKKIVNHTEHYPLDQNLPIHLLTPRSMYLRGTIKNKTLPLPLLIRKETEPLGIHLSHHGLGDKRVQPLIDVIDKLPGIRSIDLSDNRLSDVTLLSLSEKLPFMKTLTILDLSYNKIDESSKTIQNYLIQSDCILKTLILNGADIDDNECCSLALAISKNHSVKTLSLANNLIGKNELLNVLHPDLITGGEALGDMLKENKTLTKLDLSWNSIRQDSAIALAESLENNNTLKVLLLGYNSFGDMPSQILGKALKMNKSLIELNLESNSLTPKAATVLANAISFNETLITLSINGNTLGKIGAQALVAAIQRSSTETRKLQVSFINCDCNKDDENIFSAANPHGTWKMNLHEPYGQMVATECMYLANHKTGCRIIKLYHNGQQILLERAYVASVDEGEVGKLKRFKVEEFYKHSRQAANFLLEENYEKASISLNHLLKSFGFIMAEAERLVVLKKTFELWSIKAKREGRDDLQEVFLYEIFFSLFVINDADMSGTMDLDELMETLSSLGKHDYDRDAAKRLMSEYDRDDSGSIDANEFGNIMINEFCRTEIPHGELVDANTGEPWIIPSHGTCVIQLSYQCDVPTLYDIGADHGIDNIIKSIREAKTDDQREILFQNTTSSPYFFLSFEQAQLLFEEMSILNRLPLELMASILPQIVNEEQAIKFIDTNLNDIGKFAFRLKIGPMYGAFVGLRTGHYAIDLKVPSQRNGARRLGAISVTEGKECRQAGVISSQKGNFSNFRNEKLGITPVDITARWFASSGNSIQNVNILRCDYVSTDKPRKGTPSMSESRFEKLLEQLKLQEIRDVWDRIQIKERRYFERLQRQQLFLQQQLSGISDEERSIVSLSDASLSSSSPQHQQKRPYRLAKYLLHEKSDKFKDHPTGLLTTNAGYPIDFADFPELIMESPYTYTVVKENWTEYMDTCHHYWDIYPEERMRDISRTSFSTAERPLTPDALKLGPAPNRQNVPPIFPLAYRKILEMQILFPSLYITIQQLKVLLEYFPPEEGYLRIQLIQALFSHIIDLENMNMIIDEVLTFDERNEIFHRIGIMNLLDPMKPDRSYRLDLRRFDHREWVKILVTLAINEPGENWDEQEYRWGKYDDPVPGWSLPATWCANDDGGVTGGPRSHGWLRLKYRSKGYGCLPVFAVRKYLRKRTLAGMKKIF
eukprot:gene6668-7183_t